MVCRKCSDFWIGTKYKLVLFQIYCELKGMLNAISTAKLLNHFGTCTINIYENSDLLA